MHTAREVIQSTSFPQGTKVVCDLMRECGQNFIGPWRVQRIKFKENSRAHEIKCHDMPDIRDVLDDKLCQFCEGFLPREAVQHAFAGRKTDLQIANLSVKGVSAIAFEVKKGVQKCILTLNDVTGFFLRSLNESPFLRSVFCIRDVLIARTIERVLNPVLNLSFVNTASDLNSESIMRLTGCIEKLKTQRNEISACIASLKGFLSFAPLSSGYKGVVDDLGSEALQDEPFSERGKIRDLR